MDHEIYNLGTVEIIPMYLVVSKIYGQGENFQRFNTFSLIGNIGPTLRPEPWPKAHEFYNFDISPYEKIFFKIWLSLGSTFCPANGIRTGEGVDPWIILIEISPTINILCNVVLKEKLKFKTSFLYKLQSRTREKKLLSNNWSYKNMKLYWCMII